MEDAEYRRLMSRLGHVAGFMLAWLIAWIVLRG